MLNWDAYCPDYKNLLLVPAFRPDESSSHRGSVRSILMLSSQSVSRFSSFSFLDVFRPKYYNIRYTNHHKIGRDGAVGKSTSYGVDSPGIQSRRRREFPHPSRPALGPTEPPIPWVPAVLLVGRSRDRFPVLSLDFSVTYFLPTKPWPWGRLSP